LPIFILIIESRVFFGESKSLDDSHDIKLSCNYPHFIALKPTWEQLLYYLLLSVALRDLNHVARTP